PCFLCRRGRARLFLPLGHAEGMERRKAHHHPPRLAKRGARLATTRNALRRSIAAISVPRPAFPGTWDQRALPAFPCPRPAGTLRSGPSAARSGPGASRCRGYEPQQQAPHLVPSSRRLATTPSAERGDAEYSPIAKRSQRGISTAQIWRHSLSASLQGLTLGL